MPATIREQILAAVKTRLEAITDVGLVLLGGDPRIGEAAEALAGPGHAMVLEIEAHDEEPVADETASNQVETVTMAIVVYASCRILPDGLSAAEWGARIHAAVYQTYMTAENYTFDGMALDCRSLGGGAAVEQESREALAAYAAGSAFEIQYRYRRGDPFTAA